jgi:hypothetical protein
MGMSRDPSSIEGVVDGGELEALSVTGLVTLWFRVEYPVEVDRLKSGDKIPLRYPTGDKDGDEWEGGLSEDCF